MQDSRRRNGLNGTIRALHIATAATLITAATIVEVMLGAVTPTIADGIGLVAFALVVWCATSGNDCRTITLANIERDMVDIRAANANLAGLGDPIMPLPILSKFRWVFSGSIEGVALYRELLAWRADFRTAAWLALAVAVAAGVAAAAYPFVLGARFALTPWLMQAAPVGLMLLLSPFAVVVSYQDVPAPTLRTEEEVTNKIFDFIARQATPETAAKVILYALVEKGVDGASLFLRQKIASWGANKDGALSQVQASDCVQQLAQLVCSCHQPPSPPACTCGRGPQPANPAGTGGPPQPPCCPCCSKPFA